MNGTAPHPLSSEEAGRLRQWLRAHGSTPEAYIVDTFKTHDVVLLAEDHGIRHNLLLAQQLVPLLHAAGVYSLGMEFGAEEDQAALDDLVGVTGSNDGYDETLARRLMFNYNTGWAYQEYIDIYRVAWAFNRARPLGTRPFRILNLSYRYDWRAAGPVQTPESMRQVFPKGGTEPYRAALIQREILDTGEKLLILTGTPHAFTRYTLPIFDYLAPDFYRLDRRSMGQMLHQLAPDKVFTILLHQPFADKRQGEVRLVYPAGGAIDQVMESLGWPRMGFDLVGTPMGALPDDSFYATGTPGFQLSQLADGYVVEKPFALFEGCTIDKQFMTADNWPEAQANFPDPQWRPRPATPEAYWAIVRDYVDMARRYRRLGPAAD